MTLKKSEKRLLGLMGIVVVFFLVDRFVLNSGDEEPEPISKPRTAAAAAFKKLAGGSSGSAKVIETDKQNFASWGRDPFASSVSTVSASRAKSAKRSMPKLEGMFWKQGRAFVLINDIVLSEGEEDKGIRVEKINGTEVLCTQGGRTYTLHWRESP